jgi:hypothetical protein
MSGNLFPLGCRKPLKLRSGAVICKMDALSHQNVVSCEDNKETWGNRSLSKGRISRPEVLKIVSISISTYYE